MGWLVINEVSHQPHTELWVIAHENMMLYHCTYLKDAFRQIAYSYIHLQYINWKEQIKIKKLKHIHNSTLKSCYESSSLKSLLLIVDITE